MITTTNVYYLQNQPSIADELLDNLSSAVKKIFAYRKYKATTKEIQEKIIIITGSIHRLHAEVETLSDFINNYYINDILEDEEFLYKYVDILDNAEEFIDDMTRDINLMELPINIKQTLLNAYDELYTTTVTTKFLISQKVSESYLESEKNQKLLQTA
jgi:hypothetical protein